MIKLRVALVDGTFIEKEFLDHEVETVELMIEATPRDLLVRVDLEDRKERLIYSYSKTVTLTY